MYRKAIRDFLTPTLLPALRATLSREWERGWGRGLSSRMYIFKAKTL
jgi:hypothetical protein